ncbi:MAG: acetoacetyl-CoA reductase [Gammaproteobacteria bacterium]
MRNRVALVTGGMGTIGTAIIEALHAGGCKAIATFKFPGDATAETWTRSMSDKGIEVTVVECDVADFAATKAAIAEVEAQCGPVDILVNGAGITRDNTLRKMTPDQWQQVIEVNLDSVFNCTQPLIEGMTERAWGRVINISSINGQKGQFGQANYSAAKAGMHGFTKAVAQEVARKGVTVNTVSPGYIDSPMINAVPEEIREGIRLAIPVQRFGKPSEIARAVAFLADDEAGFVTGADLSVNGGQYM